MSRALNTIGDNQKAMDENMKTLADNQKVIADNQKAMADRQKTMADSQETMAKDITSLIVRSKRQDAVLKCMASEFETAYPTCSLAAKINDILDADKNPA